MLKRNDSTIKMFSFNEIGVGKSRNNALMRSTVDLCVLADEDVVYVDNYEDIILDAFAKNTKADVIIFSITIIDKKGERSRRLKNKRIRAFNSLKYGATRIAFKREKIFKHNIFFSLLFGGGAKYGSGEDSLFINDCLRKGLKIYTSSSKIANVYNYSSSWFKGYNEKYFFDKGALFAAISKKLSYLLILQFALRKYNMYRSELSFFCALKSMLRGARHYGAC